MVYTKKRKSSTISTAAPYKRRRTSRHTYSSSGLRARYSGWNPRNFSNVNKPEWKYIDFNMVTQNGANTQQLLNGLHVGNTAITRVGQKVNLRSIQCFFDVIGKCVAPVAADFCCNTWGIAIVLDRQANATQCAFADVFNTDSALSYVAMMRNLANRKRFKVVKSWHLIQSLCNTTSAFKSRPINWYHKFRRGITVDYNIADNGTYADITSNALYLMCFSLFVPTGAATSQVMFSIRVRYTDV